MPEELEPVYEYQMYRTCVKCGYEHILRNPVLEYDSERDLLKRTCRSCGFVWYEYPRDRVQAAGVE